MPQPISTPPHLRSWQLRSRKSAALHGHGAAPRGHNYRWRSAPEPLLAALATRRGPARCTATPSPPPTPQAVRLKVVLYRDDCYVRLEDTATGELFAEAPLPSDGTSLTTVGAGWGGGGSGVWRAEAGVWVGVWEVRAYQRC